METGFALGGLGVLAAFGCGAALASSAGTGNRRAAHAAASGVGAGAGGKGAMPGRIAWRVRNGVGWAKPVARTLLERKSVADLAGEARRLAEARGLEGGEEALVSCAVAVLAVATLAASAAARSLACGVAVAACLVAAVAVRLRASQDRRREALRLAVPEALQSMGVCFHAGFSLMQTFQQVALEVPDPLRTLFQRAAHRMETGQGAESALEELRSGSSVTELAFVAVALDVQHQAGGSMRQVLDAAKDTVEGEIALGRSLRVQTAQAKLSARVVSIMPFVLIAVFSLVSEGFLDPFFSGPAGLALLGLALGMQAAGIVAVRRMLAVETG